MRVLPSWVVTLRKMSMWTSRVRVISLPSRTLVTLSQRQNVFLTCSMNRCLATGSLVCHTDRNQHQRTAAYSTTSDGGQSKDWSKLFVGLAGLGVSLSAFLLWMKSGKVYAKQTQGKTGGGTAVSTEEEEKKPVEPAPPTFPDHSPYLLIGAGLASLSAFKAIKTHDPTAKVLMVGTENYTPYNRPPLSKELWYEADPEKVKDFSYTGYRGKTNSVFLSEGLYRDPSDVATDQNGGLAHIKNTKVTSLDPIAKKAVLDNGKEITFDKCLIATGGKPKRIKLFDSADENVKKRTTYFRDLNDLVDLYQITDSAKNVAVIGGGFLGSELAMSLAFKGKKTGMTVYQIFPQSAHYAKILSPGIGGWVTERVKEDGVEVLSGSMVMSASFEDGQIQLNLDSGRKVSVDHVVVAIGLEPNTELASSSGLKVDSENGGFITDSQMQVCKDIWAAGDVASYDDPMLGRRRVEHYDHADATGKLAGKNMAGVPSSYSYQSMFWADLGRTVAINAVGVIDANLQHCIFFGNTDDISKKDWKCQAIVFYSRDNKVVGVLTFNLPMDLLPLARETIKDGCEGEDLNTLADRFLNPRKDEE